MPKVAVFAQDAEFLGALNVPDWFLKQPPRVAHLGLIPRADLPEDYAVKPKLRMGDTIPLLVEDLRFGDSVTIVLICSTPEKARVALYFDDRKGDACLMH